MSNEPTRRVGANCLVGAEPDEGRCPACRMFRETGRGAIARLDAAARAACACSAPFGADVFLRPDGTVWSLVEGSADEPAAWHHDGEEDRIAALVIAPKRYPELARLTRAARRGRLTAPGAAGRAASTASPASSARSAAGSDGARRRLPNEPVQPTGASQRFSC